jgi:tetratricopeptide (TPR) repeat protein
VFVQCAPAQGKELIKRVREDLPQKRIESMSLSKEIKNLYERVEDVAKYTKPNILFIRGIENSFVPYIKSGFGGQGDYYKLDSVPPILNHLNLQRERFRSSTQICFVFLLPLFGMKYFIQRAPDFFDWRSGLFKIATDKNIANITAKEIYLSSNYSEYPQWTFSKRIKRILGIETYLTEEIDLDNKVNLYLELGSLWFINGDYEEAIASYDKALEIKPDYYEVWGNRGVALNDLGKYEEAIASYDKVLEIKPDKHEVWYNRGIALINIGRNEEAIASYDKVLEIKPDKHEAWYSRGVVLGNLARYEEAIASYDKALEIKPAQEQVIYNKACAFALQGNIDLAIDNLGQAILLSLEEYREMAKTDSDFDSIRHDPRFQELIQ